MTLLFTVVTGIVSYWIGGDAFAVVLGCSLFLIGDWWVSETGDKTPEEILEKEMVSTVSREESEVADITSAIREKSVKINTPVLDPWVEPLKNIHDVYDLERCRLFRNRNGKPLTGAALKGRERKLKRMGVIWNPEIHGVE